MATATKNRPTNRKQGDAQADEAPRPLPGQTSLLGGEQQPKRILMRRDHFGTSNAGEDIWAKGGLDYEVVRRTDDGVIVVVGEDRDELEVPVGSYAVTEWHAAAERKPKRVQLVTAVTLHTKDGPKSIEPPEQFDVVEVHTKGVIIDVKKLGRWPIGQGEYKVIAWSDSPAPKSVSIAAAARAAKEPPKTNGDVGYEDRQKLWKKTKAKPGEAATAPAAAIGELPVRQLTVDQLVRHPKNRTPKPADVDVMAESLKADGQIDPLLVRPCFGTTDFYMIVSGETRWRAAKQAGLKTLACRVIECDDARALELLAICNAKRTDLDPIEKARMIVELCKPTADGGANMTREAAAKVYGLESGAAASNLVGLLELPKPWQDRVASGELPQTFARELRPYVAAANVMKAIDEDYVRRHRPKASADEREPWESRASLDDHLTRLIDESTRPIDKKLKQRYTSDAFGDRGWNYSGFHPRMFELTDELKKSLDIVALPLGDKGKLIEVATNVKAYDALQVPAIKAKVDADSKKRADTAGSDQPKAKKALTAAQQKAADQEKAKQLKARIDGWRHTWLKGLIAELLADSKAIGLDHLVDKYFAAILLYGNAGTLVRDVSDALTEGLPKGVSFDYGTLADAYDVASGFDVGRFKIWMRGAMQKMLAAEDNDPKYPRLPHELIDAIALALRFDVARLWREWFGTDRESLEKFLLLHQGDQLKAQAKEWGVHIPDTATRKGMVTIILAKETKFALPKSIRLLGGAKKGAKPR